MNTPDLQEVAFQGGSADNEQVDKGTIAISVCDNYYEGSKNGDEVGRTEGKVP